MTACGYQVQIAANAGLGRMDVAEVVSAVDDPELRVAGREVEDLLVLRQDNESRKPQLGMNGHDVAFRVVHDAS